MKSPVEGQVSAMAKKSRRSATAPLADIVYDADIPSRGDFLCV